MTVLRFTQAWKLLSGALLSVALVLPGNPPEAQTPEGVLPIHDLKAWQNGPGAAYEAALEWGDTATAMRAVSELAVAGDPWAQAILGTDMIEGQLGERDVLAGLGWLKLSARNGNPWGLNGLGLAYVLGDGLEPDPAVGIALMQQAADIGSSVAMMNLSIAAFRGTDGAPDLERSLMWSTLATAVTGDYAPPGRPALYWAGVEASIRSLNQLGFLAQQPGVSIPRETTDRMAALEALAANGPPLPSAQIWAGAFICNGAPVGAMLMADCDLSAPASMQPAVIQFFPSPYGNAYSTGCLSGAVSIARAPGQSRAGAFLWAPENWVGRPPAQPSDGDAMGVMALDNFWIHGRVIGPSCSDFVLQRVLVPPVFPDPDCRPLPGSTARGPESPKAPAYRIMSADLPWEKAKTDL